MEVEIGFKELKLKSLDAAADSTLIAAGIVECATFEMVTFIKVVFKLATFCEASIASAVLSDVVN